MNERTIPEAAIDAAWKKLHDSRVSLRCPTRGEMASALEAAAPHMLAEAWGEGYVVAKEAIRQLDPINPYRSQA